MVAIVSGNGLGLLTGSAGELGQRGVFGDAVNGSSKETAYLNIAQGNLTLQNQDDFLVAHGVNLAFTRTYNSQGTYEDGNGANWKVGMIRRVTGLTGTVNTAGSTVTRTEGDGSAFLFAWDATLKAYVSTDGGGGYQSITFNATTREWTWTADRRGKLGAPELAGLHEIYDATANGRLVSTRDELNTVGTAATPGGPLIAKQGSRINYYYDAAGRLSQIMDADAFSGLAGKQGVLGSSDQIHFDYDANGNLTQVRSLLKGSASAVWTRTHYAYDDLNRLTAAIVDLTPEGGDISDGKTYTTTYTYDGDSNRIATISESDGTKLAFTYENGKVKTSSDALGRKLTLDYAIPGRTTVTDQLGNQTVYGYDGVTGRLTSVTGPAVDGVSQEVLYTYDAAGNVKTMTAPGGAVTSYVYDAYGNCTQQWDAAGNTVSRTYHANSNRLLTETAYGGTDPDREKAGLATLPMTTRYVYDAANRLRFQISAEGRVTEYRYDSLLGELNLEYRYNGTAYADPAADEAKLKAWVASAAVDKTRVTLVECLRDMRGQVLFTIDYTSTKADGSGVTAPEQLKAHTRDQSGRLIKTEDARGTTGIFKYDGMHRLLEQTDINGAKLTTNYDQAGSAFVTSSVSKATTRHVYNAAGQLLSTTRSAGGVDNVTGNLYDANGRLRRSTGAAGQQTFWLYDAAGRKLAQIEHNGALTEYFYNAAGLLAKSTRYAEPVSTAGLVGANGVPLEIDLDTLRPTKANADDRSTWMGYDLAGRLNATIDANGYLARMAYDGASRLVQTIYRTAPVDVSKLTGLEIPAASTDEITLGEDRVSRQLYDRDGLLVGKLGAAGYLTENKYNAGGQLIETVAYFTVVPPATRAAGDMAALRLAATPNPARDMRQYFIYDGKGQLAGTIDGDGFLTEMSYDGVGNVTRKRRYATPVTTVAGQTMTAIGKTTRDAEDRITDYSYTKLGQLQRETNIDGSYTAYEYDHDGKLVHTMRGAGTAVERSTRARYDALGRLVLGQKPPPVTNCCATNSITCASPRKLPSANTSCSSLLLLSEYHPFTVTWSVTAAFCASATLITRSLPLRFIVRSACAMPAPNTSLSDVVYPPL